MKNKNKPLVSVCCTTYNHEHFISDAIEGFLIQKTTFPVEFIIHDDASTDKTAAIVKKYADKYPELIIAVLQTENQYSKGNKPLTNIVFPRTSGKYIAICEGDDYWTDPYKLQKQVDFLEENSSYSFCFHDNWILNENTGEKKIRIGEKKIDEVVDLESLIVEKNISTASIMFRNIIQFDNLPDWFYKLKNGDYGILVLLTEKGLGKYIPEPMSVYRMHDGGIWSGKFWIDNLYLNIDFYNYLLKYFREKRNKKIVKVLKEKKKYTNRQIALHLCNTGKFRRGYPLLLMNLSFFGDRRFPTNPRILLGTIKAGLTLHLKQYGNSNQAS